MNDDWLGVLRDVVASRTLREAADLSSPRARFLAARFDESQTADAFTSRRYSRRHPCGAPVLVDAHRHAALASGEMLDASADGAQLRTDERLVVGTACRILVATGDGERSGIAFSARVVWRDRERGRVGVVFVGRPVVGDDVLPDR